MRRLKDEAQRLAPLGEEGLLQEIYKARASKLASLANQLGQDLRLAKLLEMSPVRLHRLIRKQDVPFTEKVARAIESKLNKPQGWLDQTETSVSNNPHNLPVYFLEDLKDLESVTPSTYCGYITDIPNAYFVQILSSSYAPQIQNGAKILINPNVSAPEEGHTYLVSYELNGNLTKPVIRRFSKNGFINISDETQEVEDVASYKIYGRCELVISPKL